jgi:hypothetical protein
MKRQFFGLILLIVLSACNSDEKFYHPVSCTYSQDAASDYQKELSASEKHSAAGYGRAAADDKAYYDDASTSSAGQRSMVNNSGSTTGGPEDGMFGFDPNYENPDNNHDMDHYMNETDDEWAN